MVLDIDGVEYKVTFTHSRNLNNSFRDGVPVVNVTTCRIGLNMPWLMGIARFDPSQRYTEELGEKLSFADAIREIPEKTQTELWKAYWAVKESK